MDPKSEWALGEFRDAAIELRLLEHRNTGGAAAAKGGSAGDIRGSPQQQGPEGSVSAAAPGGRRRLLPIRSAYQGERLAGLLVVKIEAGAGERRAFLGVMVYPGSLCSS